MGPDARTTTITGHMAKPSWWFMPHTRNRLSIRIPWMIEAVAEGPLAIVACLLLASAVLICRAVGWW